MNQNPPFLKDFNPAGRIVFATTPSKHYINMFEEIIKLTGRKLSNVLVSMFYLRGDKGPEKLQRVRNLCDRFFVDSGVFSFRSQFLKEMGISIRVAYWKLPMEEKERLWAMGKKYRSEFDAFAEEYARFLDRHKDSIDVAIDLDVEQFLGLDVAEQYYQQLQESLDSSKIMRVWHGYGRDIKDWEAWCSSGAYKWLALEGPDQHNREVDFYRKFIRIAHKYGVNVHVLAVTTLSFLNLVATDTCDSSTYTVGGRWARLIMPDGRDVLVGTSYKKYYGNHYDNLPKDWKDYADSVFDYFGFSVEELQESHYLRCMFNVLVFLMYYDKPAVEAPVSIELF